MENELNSYKTNTLKQSIQMGYNDFRDFYYPHGQLGEALESYVRTQEYCVYGRHIVSMCLNVILVSIELGNFAHVANYASKAEQTLGPNDPTIGAKLQRAAGLALLEMKEYKHAATSHFASYLQYLENLEANLLLDIHSHDHVDALYAQIRQKAIIQYTIPFISVDLDIMASAFKTNVWELEKEIEILMAENKIQVRIDTHHKILHAWHAVQRNTAFQRVLQSGSELDQYVRAMLLRANLAKLEHNVRTNWLYT